jgi:hypothetical protein
VHSLGDRFWQIVDGTVAADYDARLDALGAALSKMSKEELPAFDTDLGRASVASYRWDRSGAAHVINGGLSDDGFADSRSWLTVPGKVVYDCAMADPESLADHISEAFAESGELTYVPMELF